MNQPLVKAIRDILNDHFLTKWQFSLTFHIVWLGREWLPRTVHYRQYTHPFPSTWASHIHFHISAFNHSFPIQAESKRSVTKTEAVNKSWNKRVLVKPLLCSSMFSLEHIECFHSRGQHLCKFIGTKESVCIRKEYNSQRIGLGHQHGRRFIVFGHQYGRRDVMWKHSISRIFMRD